MRNLLVGVAPGRTEILCLLALTLALGFMLVADRGWPVRLGPDFPQIEGNQAHPAAAATLFVYSPDARPMRLRTNLFVDEPQKLPPLQVSVTHGETTDITIAATRPAAEAPLRLTHGINSIRLTIGAPRAEPTAFLVDSVRRDASDP